jgi:hypothetical protein
MPEEASLSFACYHASQILYYAVKKNHFYREKNKNEILTWANLSLSFSVAD